MIENLIDRTVLVHALEATERDAALAEVTQAFVAKGLVKADATDRVVAELIAREGQGSTGLGNGVAVPHVKETDVDEISVAVGITEPGLEFDAIDGRPVHILFVVLGPTGGPPDQHLTVLRWVSTLARNADFRRFALDIENEDGLRDLLREMTE